MTNPVCVLQLYTVSQDGTLCVWESDTEPDGLVLRRPRETPQPAGRLSARGDQAEEEEEEEENREEGEEGEPRGEVVKGKADGPKETEGVANVRYKLISK